MRAFFLSFVFLLSLLQVALAQDTEDKDSLPPKEWQFTSVVDLADTAWWALQKNTNTEFLTLVPSLKIIKATFDSLEIKNNPQVIKLKYNYISYKVSKQLKLLRKKASRNKLKFKTCELEKVNYKEGKDDKNNTFAYVHLECRKSKKTFRIKFVALQLNGYWYIVDELMLEFPEDDPYYKAPIKRK